MPDSDATDAPLGSLVAQAEQLLPPAADPVDRDIADRVASLLRAVEDRSPRGASLHAQLDTVVKWVRVLAEPGSHDRYGGTARLREHVALQFRLAQAAVADYTSATHAKAEG